MGRLQARDQGVEAHAARALEEDDVARAHQPSERAPGGLDVGGEGRGQPGSRRALVEAPRLARDGHERGGGGGGGEAGGLVVLGGGEGAELAHLAEHDDEAPPELGGQLARGVEPGGDRGEVGVVAVVEHHRAVAEHQRCQAAGLAIAGERGEGALERGDGELARREGVGDGQGGAAGVGPGLAEQGRMEGMHDRLGRVAGGRGQRRAQQRADEAPRLTPEQPHLGALGAPVGDAAAGRGDAGQLRDAVLVVGVGDGDAVRAEGVEDGALFAGDVVEAAEAFGVLDRDARQDGDVGLGERAAVRHLAGARGADFDDGGVVFGPEAEQNDGDADGVIKVPRRGVHRAPQPREQRRDRAPRGGLADRAGDGHDRAPGA